jgi:hypothetical protein
MAVPTTVATQTIPSAAETAAPAQTASPAETGQMGAVTVDASGVAQTVTSQVVAAVPASDDGPWWEAMPQYTLLTLEGYPITNHLLTPQIFVYPAQDLPAANENAGQIVADLQALLQNPQDGQLMPFLPLYNAAQVMHAQVKSLDFKNGKGVRYLTQFDQAMLPINNHELIYTYQGLTSDGKYYVAAVLPVNLAGLPANENDLDNLPAEFTSDFPKYLSNTVSLLDQQSPASFTPDLNKLDTMMGSLDIK